MDIYKTNNNNIFYTFIKIDNKKIELDFVLTVENSFYCDVFIQNKANIKSKTYLTVQQYNFNRKNFIIPTIEFNKYLTNRQIELLKKEIRRIYKQEILKIKFNEIFSENKDLNVCINEYEKYRKYA